MTAHQWSAKEILEAMENTPDEQDVLMDLHRLSDAILDERARLHATSPVDNVYECIFCLSLMTSDELIANDETHSDDCPVLVARKWSP